MKTFVKTNPQQNNSLLCEADGLNLLQQKLNVLQNPLAIPEIIDVNKSRLELEFIDSQVATSVQMKQLGKGLANLHSLPQQKVGLAEDNFIGLSPQINGRFENWGAFFYSNRLCYQVDRIGDYNLRTRYQRLLNSHKTKLVDFLNANCERFSLLHGDLWSGNVLFDTKQVWLIDPAVYFGDNEVDIAMTEMFGGFSADFYSAYQQTLSLSAAYQRKSVIYNLYHYLNHLNLFGTSYLPGCEQGFSEIAAL